MSRARALASLLAGAPSNADTLAELATAVAANTTAIAGNTDAIVANAAAVALRAPIASPTFTGTVGMTRSQAVAGASVALEANPRVDLLSAGFTTASGADVQAFQTPEIPRVFPGAAGKVRIDLTARVQSARAGSAAGTYLTLRARTKTAGTWSAWSSLGAAVTDVLHYTQSGGAASVTAAGTLSPRAVLDLASGVTDYQIEVLARVAITGSSPESQLFAGSAITTVEHAA